MGEIAIISRTICSGILALGALGLSACAVPGTDQSQIRAVAQSEARILFAADAFRGTTPRRALFEDDWEREEYALFKGGGAQAELIYSTSVNHNVALEYPFNVRETVGTWNMSRHDVPGWGPAGEIPGAFGTLYTQSFKLGGTGRPCVGFSAEWDWVADDPETRADKVLFGYYCAPAGAALSEERIDSILGTVGIRGVTERLPKKYRGGFWSDSPAKTARGASPTADTGNAGFPFRFGQYFTVSGGGEQQTN